MPWEIDEEEKLWWWLDEAEKLRWRLEEEKNLRWLIEKIRSSGGSLFFFQVKTAKPRDTVDVGRPTVDVGRPTVEVGRPTLNPVPHKPSPARTAILRVMNP
ncbi:hypothetical protein F2Q69_00055363 [Brassica cretica]|uniref:Uncharacterized protein n=1 Tax=Brassica cretica TaxID=69181 RepID=A0A8S9MZ00_BRACR|nr:hypothetical protein F2Q69_00055363 [Brassica cretica]